MQDTPTAGGNTMKRYWYTTYDGKEYGVRAANIQQAAQGVEKAEYARTNSHAAAAVAVDSLRADA
jgi:hypothetical protein